MGNRPIIYIRGLQTTAHWPDAAREVLSSFCPQKKRLLVMADELCAEKSRHAWKELGPELKCDS